MCCDSLFSNYAKVNNTNRIDFEKLLRAALQNNFFSFEGKISKQIDGAAVGSPLGLTLANTLCLHEQIWLNECPVNSNLHNTEDMLMTCLFCFVHLIILRNLKTKF